MTQRQQVMSYRLTTTPATRVLQTRDYFGTTVDHLGVRAPHDELLVVAEASVETRDRGHTRAGELRASE